MNAEYDKIVALLIENHFVETSPYETIKHLIETHQDYKEGEEVPSLLTEIKRLREEAAYWKKTAGMLVQAHQSVYGSDD